MDKDAARTNPQAETVEDKVNTVDYRTSAGEDEATKEPVQIVHSTTEENPTPAEKARGILTGAAVKASNTAQSAKDAIPGVGTGSDESKKEGGCVAAKGSDPVHSAKDGISGTGGTDGNENKKEGGGGVAATVSEKVQAAKEAVTGAIGSHDDKKDGAIGSHDDKKETAEK